MEFEFDPDKSLTNKAKHGIDFVEAQALWDDPWLLVAPARTEGEPRNLSIGQLDGRHWAAIWAMRNGKVRLISVRRARREEVDYYENT